MVRRPPAFSDAPVRIDTMRVSSRLMETGRFAEAVRVSGERDAFVSDVRREGILTRFPAIRTISY